MTLIVKRAYTGSNVQMLTVLHTLVANAKEHQSELQAIINTYTPEYYVDLETRISNAVTTFFGKDFASKLRNATELVTSLQKEALEDLSFLKLVIEERFRKEPAFVEKTLKELGFDGYFKSAKNRSQEALVQLLAQFRQHITEEVKAKIVAAGGQAALIERILAKSNELLAANVSQEVFKDSRKGDTQEALTQFNDLYLEVIGIAKIAARVFKDNANLKDKFNYTKHLKALTGSASAATVAKKAKAEKALATV